MDKSKILDALKLIKEAFITTTQTFTDEKLNDGVTIIRYDVPELAVGASIMVVTDAGAIAIPDGDYTTANGVTFTTAGGVITIVSGAPEGDMAKKPNAQAQAPAPAQGMNEAQAKSIIESIIKESRFATEDFVTEYVKELTTVKETFANQKTESEKSFNDLKQAHELLQAQFSKALELIEKIAELPSSTPAEKPNKAFDLKEFKKQYKEDLLNITNQ